MSERTASVPIRQAGAPGSASSGVLQRKCSCGNRTIAGDYCAACSRSDHWRLQTKLHIGGTGDLYEREADRVADQIVTTRANARADGLAPRIQRLAREGGGSTVLAEATVTSVLSSPGRPLEEGLRADMEERFGHDFSNVRVHTDAAADQSAKELSAHAYTAGQHIAFAANQFAPYTETGRRLLAHELTHVVQQSADAVLGKSATRASHDSGASLVQRSPDKEAAPPPPSSPYPEEEDVIRYAIGAHDLGKLTEGTVLYNQKDWRAVGLSDSAFAAGPFTTDMGQLFYVYRLVRSDDKTNVRSFSRGSYLGGWGNNTITHELVQKLLKAEAGKTIEVRSTGLIPPTGGASPKPQGKADPKSTGGGTQETSKPTEEAAADELTPHRKKWLKAGRDGMKHEINALFNSIQKVKAKRIDVWEKNARIKDPKPIKKALEVAVEVVGYGMGGVVGGLLTKSMAHGLLTEFVKESGLKSTVKLAEYIFEHAVEPAEELMNEATKKALEKDKESNAKAALASKGDLLDCYVESVSLQTISEEAAEHEAFNATVDAKYSDLELADEVAVFDALFKKLLGEPAYFMRELSVGVIRLKDEVYLEEKAKGYGGDVNRLLKEDPHIHETAERSGNLLVLAGMGDTLGKYYSPRVDFDSFYALSTEVNKATLMELSKTPVKDLPITLTFRFWASNPFTRWGPFAIFSEPFCKVWFERRPNGDVWVDFDESTVGMSVSTGIEWLASYYMHTIGIPAGHELSDQERHKYAAPGAAKVYKLVENKKIENLSNSDVF